jgi:uncharacterized protein (TIGR02147 family)
MQFLENTQKTLASWLGDQRGVRSKLSRHLGVRPSFISQLTAGKNQLTLEQALKVALFFHLNQKQTDYWLDLVSLERSGTHELKGYLERRAERSRNALNRINDRLRAQTSDSAMNKDEQARYYSSWLFGAVHILTTIPEYQSAASISKRLRISDEDLKPVLRFLKECGLIAISPNGTCKATLKRMHLDSESPWILSHHAHWRARAVDSLNRQPNRRGIHFSSAMTLSREDASRIREELLKMLQSIEARLPASAEEECMVLNLDWFSI